MARVALLSGGKDSFYAALRAWPPDYGLVLTYWFPEPSPHQANLPAVAASLALAGVPIVVAGLPPGREAEATVSLLRRLGAEDVVAGDVYIEDHLRYMEWVAGEAGARLLEPLWGRDPEDLLYEIVEAGVEAVVVGAREGLERLLGLRLSRGTARLVAGEAERLGFDPLGERGEYHTLVTNSPVHQAPLEPTVRGAVGLGGVRVLLVDPPVAGAWSRLPRLLPGDPLPGALLVTPPGPPRRGRGA